MQFIDQTKLYSKTIRGNCIAACFASYFNLNIDDVPPFEEIDDYDSEIVYWMQEMGYEIETESEDLFFKEGFYDYYFAIGKSPRNENIYHLVVYRNGKLAHDPHPDKTGIVGSPIKYWYINKKDPC